MVDHPCARGLTRACFAAYPAWARQALAYKLLHILLPKQLTKRLPGLLSKALIAPGAILPPGVELPPGTIVAPDVSFPPGWTPGDPLPPGVQLPLPVFPYPTEVGAAPPLFINPWEPGPPHSSIPASSPIILPGSQITVPSSDYIVQWNRSAGSYNYALIDEYPAINDADYNYSPTYNLFDLFHFTPFSVPSTAVITNVKLYVRAKRNVYNRALLIGMGIHGDNWWAGCGGVISSSFAEYSATWTTNPHSGLPWTVNDVNSVGINGIQNFGYIVGFDPEGYDDTLYVSRLYLKVNYT